MNHLSNGFPFEKFGFTSNQHHHHLMAIMTATNYNMPQKTFMGGFIVGFHTEALQNLANFQNGFINGFVLNIEIFNSNHIMAIFAIKTSRQLTVDFTDWNLSFIAVVIWFGHANRWQYRNLRHARNFFQVVFHLFLFED